MFPLLHIFFGGKAAVILHTRESEMCENTQKGEKLFIHNIACVCVLEKALATHE